MTATTMTCDRTITRGVEHGRLLLENGSWEELRASREIYGELILWLPLPFPSLGVLGFRRLAVPPDPPLASATVVTPPELLAGTSGKLSALRVLRAEHESACCGSRQVLELVTDEIVFRAWAHRPGAGLPPQLSSLRSTYPARQAAAADVCDWAGRAVDALEPAALLVQGVAGAAGGPPHLHVLWRDGDGEPRGWETFGNLSDPRALHRALEVELRYATRDEALLVVDSSRPPLPGRPDSAGPEAVAARPFDRPAFEWLGGPGVTSEGRSR